MSQKCRRTRWYLAAGLRPETEHTVARHPWPIDQACQIGRSHCGKHSCVSGAIAKGLNPAAPGRCTNFSDMRKRKTCVQTRMQRCKGSENVKSTRVMARECQPEANMLADVACSQKVQQQRALPKPKKCTSRSANRYPSIASLRGTPVSERQNSRHCHSNVELLSTPPKQSSQTRFELGLAPPARLAGLAQLAYDDAAILRWQQQLSSQ